MRIFVDTADLSEIDRWCNDDRIDGVTTNPSLMKAAGVRSPLAWAKDVMRLANGKPVSIDGPPEIIWSIGAIPKVTRIPWSPVYTQPVNLTAVCTVAQTRIVSLLPKGSIVSVFAGRIMDTGRDPKPVIEAAKKTRAQVLWASVREPYNLMQADIYGCDIVTVTPAILSKWFEWGRYSLEEVAAKTIAQFQEDQAQW